jgi:hypothetical protein
MPRMIEVELKDLFLDQENPRFEPVRDEAEAINELCMNEQIVPVAESIAIDGISPLELIAVTEVRAPDGAGTGTYLVREGNRRLAAMKLLIDPDKAPTAQQASFRKLTSARVPQHLQVMLFETKNEIDPWLRLLHQRDQNPAGRRSWKAEQQARAFGSTRNQKAVNLTDFAVASGWIDKADRIKRLSTVERWISNAKVRSYLGITFQKDADEVVQVGDLEKSNAALKYFFSQVANREINTRANKTEMEKWIKAQSKPVKGDPDSVDVGRPTSDVADVQRLVEPKKPEAPKYEHLPFREDIESALKKLGNQKLQALYHELATTSIHSTQLLCIGWWAFLTTLCSVVQDAPSSDYSSFLSHERLQKLGFEHSEHRKNLVMGLKSISQFGNTAKHSTVATLLNPAQLYNDVEVVGEVVLALLEVLNGDRIPKGKYP